MKNSKIICNKIIKYVIILIFIIFGLYNISYTLGKQYNEKHNVKIFGYQLGVVTGNGMEPEFEHNDIVIYKNVNDEKLKEKDIITTYKNGKLVIRRITLKKMNGKYVTKADKYLYNDSEELTDADIEGKVYKVIPNLRIYSKNIAIWSHNWNYYELFNIDFYK